MCFKRLLSLFGIITCIVLVMVSGCTSAVTTPAVQNKTPSDPVIGHWGGLMDTVYITLDVYPDGTATMAGTGSMTGSQIVPASWTRNPNGTYTILTSNPGVATVDGNKMVISSGGDDLELTRGSINTPK
ncbi:MAG: hypothetical protein WC586_13510 [Methanoregula sp.]